MPQLNLSVDEQMYKDVAEYAQRFGISLAAAVRVLLRRALDSEQAQ